jgi:hypothetical protein
MTASSQQTAQPTIKYLGKYMVLTCKYFRYHTSTPLDCRLDNHALTTPTYRSVEANGTIHYHSSEWHPYYCMSYEQRNRKMMQKPPSQYLNSHLKSLFGHKGYDHWHTLSFVNEIFLKKAYRSISWNPVLKAISFVLNRHVNSNRQTLLWYLLSQNRPIIKA